MSELDLGGDAIAKLLKAVMAGGWGAVAALASFMAAGIGLYLKSQKFYKKHVDQQNAKQAQEAAAQNPVDNKADEINQKKAENEIEDIIKGGQ